MKRQSLSYEIAVTLNCETFAQHIDGSLALAYGSLHECGHCCHALPTL